MTFHKIIARQPLHPIDKLGQECRQIYFKHAGVPYVVDNIRNLTGHTFACVVKRLNRVPLNQKFQFKYIELEEVRAANWDDLKP